MTIILIAIISLTLAGCQTYKPLMGLTEADDAARLEEILGVDVKRVRWCGAYAAHVVRRQGKQPPQNYLAVKSWYKWGKPVDMSDARKGDILIVNPKYWSHLGFYDGETDNLIRICGGNQGNAVKCSWYAKQKILMVRR